MPWVFGYGSLLLRKSAERTMPVKDVVVGRIKGYERYWGVRSTATTPSSVMGVRKNPEKSCVGVFLNVDEEAFTNLDSREQKYDRVRLSPDEYEAKSVSGNVYVYIPRPENAAAPKTHGVRQEYYETCIQGAKNLEIYDEFIAQTSGWEYLDSEVLEELDLTENLSQTK